jgi:hypothetical protein
MLGRGKRRTAAALRSFGAWMKVGVVSHGLP